MKIQGQCSICGEPTTMEIPDDIPQDSICSAMLSQIAPMVSHDRCFDDRFRRIDEEAKELMKIAEWKSVCPPLYQLTEPSKIPAQEALSKVMEWAYGPTGIVMYGRSGRGKTRAAYLLLKREFDIGKAVTSINHADFSRQICRGFDHQKATERWLKLLATIDLLLVDDLGKAKFTDYRGVGKQAEEVLFDLIEKRITTQMPTIYTMNCTSEALMGIMSPDRAEPFVRRLKESSVTIHF